MSVDGGNQNNPRLGGWFRTKTEEGKYVPRGFGLTLGNLNLQNVMSGVGNLASAISVSTGGYNMYGGPNGGLTLAIDLGWDSAASTLSQLGPWGLVAGGIMKGVGMLNKVQNAFLGSKGTDNMTKLDAVMNSPLGFPVFGLVNALGGSNAQTITKDYESFSTVGSSYGGTGNAVDDALTKSGKRYGTFSKSARMRADEEIAEAKRQLTVMSSIADLTNIGNDLRATMTGINANANMFNMAGGYQQANVHAARYGMKFEKAYNIAHKEPIIEEVIEENDQIEEIIEDYFSNWEYKSLPEVDKFEKGGSINLIPEGALHARKHSIDLEDITEKGIPVVSESEGGEIQLHAEIERDEIIFRLEVTELIEEARKKYESDDTKLSEKDDIAIEIGKLLVNEILYNTKDNTNLIKTIE